MKKIITLLAVVGMFSLQGCTTTDSNYVDNDTISTVFETKPVSFVASSYAVKYIFRLQYTLLIWYWFID